MGLLDNIKSMAGSLGAQGGLMTELTSLLNAQAQPGQDGGGLGGLVRAFQANGLGAVVASWIGTGGNHPVTPQQIEQVLGAERIQAIASKVGMDSAALTNQIASTLPGLVDQLTPHGHLPDGTTAAQVAQGVAPSPG
jgi:uncharacterized protein YidB (DUF937 family)